MKIRAVSFLLLLLLPAMSAEPQQPRPEPIPMLTVNGTGEARAEPDEATVRLGVTRQAPTAQVAQEQVNQAATAMLAAFTRLGVKREQIQTSQLTLFPIYAPQKPGMPEEPRIVAYRATNVVSVRMEKLGQVGAVIDAGLKSGANQLEGVSFGLRDDLPHRERALREAVREARQKARTMAEALEVRLVSVSEVQEGGVSIRPPVFMGEAAMAARAAPTPVSPGQVTVHASVTIRYRIAER